MAKVGFRVLGTVKKTGYYTAGGQIFPGDAVAMQADGKVDQASAGSGNPLLGVCMGKKEDGGLPADGDEIIVYDDPGQEYVVEASSSDMDAQTDVGNTCPIAANSGDSTYNISRQQADTSSLGTSANQLMITGVDKEEGNALSDSNTMVRVKIDKHQLGHGGGQGGI